MAMEDRLILAKKDATALINLYLFVCSYNIENYEIIGIWPIVGQNLEKDNEKFVTWSKAYSSKSKTWSVL